MDITKNIIIVAGHPGAGKTTFCNLFSEIYSCKNINTGKCIAEFLSLNNFKIGSKENWGDLFLKNFPVTKVFEVINQKINGKDVNYVLDGIRLFSTYLEFLDNYSNVRSILITANEEVRTKRLFNRLTDEGLSKIDAAKAAEQKDKFQIDFLKFETCVDFKIENNGSVIDLKEQIQDLNFPKIMKMF
jgi:dephospho-CoA kinase